MAARYVYRGAIAVVDAQHLLEQLAVAAPSAAQPEAASQLALADVVAVSKADLVGAPQLEAVREAVAAVHPGVRTVALARQGAVPAELTDIALQAERSEAASVGRWLSAYGAHRRLGRHAGVSPFVLELVMPPSRGQFSAAMHDIQARYDRGLLRIKGLVCFVGEAAPCVVHGVHRQLYPLEPLAQWPDECRNSRLVFIVRGLDPDEVADFASQALGQRQAHRPLSK
ncbi:CobW family GTP-binding protein [Bordetella holmesii]|uniref:CobW/HypB/UreG, nucleotide-binding domain protein n=1 Tax=Bordetella holmesii 1058 TaxID=1247648 RepID=A0ABP3BEJ8_9BORD|nr:GTP-binding protein [Bordetella holmesii]AHV94608.1 cobW/HypB/UreG, nucleotide-binding domain protein [Bordetella holmesii ATCC 51541]AIT27561.1 cobW/HypB/UreG, nucleotide-binding domain protein [Bordetella holmesii 44057]AMD46377.1 hypothetical protein H558_13215 [Bordetella holmesii H558]EWM42845.1 cobW/HypB/UreG, nucleotide-binding domain protein [Bordetella holmesii 41130]EWM48153.1 cobW/HypB/UreG, nucleotide-binding domain protein [Bordetella holmesii 35009]EWM49134.1 cobW/HypB/UreG, 